MDFFEIAQYRLIFWDFDGVIKDSVDVKTRAFVRLFEHFGPSIETRVRQHHESHGGMSRFEKLPLYLEWCGVDATDERIDSLVEQFSRMVVDSVINSPWVPGVEDLLRRNPYHQQFYLVSATPKDELDQILDRLELRKCFVDVFGAPVRKQDAIGGVLLSSALPSQDCLMIGDSMEDLKAANENRVPFLLRSHPTNAVSFLEYAGPSVNDFTHL